MTSRNRIFVITQILTLVAADLAAARVWTDASGKYTIDADLIAFNNRNIVIERADHQLGELPIEKLSKADQEYLKSKEASETAKRIGEVRQTWTLRNGLKLLARVVGYAQKELKLERHDGNIYVNGKQFETLPSIYQQMIPKIVADMVHLKRDDRQALEDWLVTQKGHPQPLTVDGALMKFENGDEYVVPFAFFSSGDLALLRPGWDQWLAAHSKQQNEQQEYQSFMVQSLMAARQRDAQIQQQIAQMQINQQILLGNTYLWEVTLYPGRGVVGRPQWVTVPAINSRIAINDALRQYPGYVAGPVRKVAGY